MQLSCPHCQHVWDDVPPERATQVMCPECLELAPVLRAGASAAAIASPAAPPRQAAPAAAAGGGATIPQSDFGSIPGSRPPATPSPARPAPPPPAHDGRTMAEPTPAGQMAPSDGRTVATPTPAGARPAPQAPPSRNPPATPPRSSAARPRPSGPPKSSTAGVARDMQHLVGRTIDGYRIEKMLGAGGMGAVFLAHQISLDRDVAMKVLPTRFAQNPELLARFTREALSAAQLNHHNIIQVYDVGSNEDVHYITMEFVRGQDLSQLVKQDGRLRLDDAAGYILQAARGLKYAHERGIIHRDIKPNNLMLNEHGVVKIADMGLAKMRGKHDTQGQLLRPTREELMNTPADDNLTLADVAMGTPAYMAPEQARDAASVDARADIYSLGCTLYYLAAGRNPFDGGSAFELITKHMKEPLTPLDAHIKGVSPAINTIIGRMLAKNPDERYPTMEGVIRDLEKYLGLDSEKGPYTPREQHLGILDAALKAYYTAPALRLRKAVRLAFLVAVPVLFLLALFSGSYVLAGGFLGFGVLTAAARFIIHGVMTKDYLFRRVRGLFFGMPLVSWLKVGAGALLALAVLYVLGWLWSWLGFLLFAVAAAGLYQVLVEQKLRQQRAGAIEQTQEMLRELRVRGVSEETLHDFVARFSGKDWEEFFEQLFGYEALVVARGRWAAADQVESRNQHAAWREPVNRWVTAQEEKRRAARERKQLAKVEAERLKARGVSETDARRQAGEAATRILDEQKQQHDRRERDQKALAERGAALDQAIKSSRRKKLGAAGWFRVARAVAGLLMLVAPFAEGLGLPDLLVGPIRGIYAPLGAGVSIWGAAAGAALLVSALSVRMVAPIIIVLGAFFVACANLAAEQSAALVPGAAVTIGLALLAAGLALHVMNKLAGKAF
ncbi:MAG TPA: protein kinase [Candidatus Sumerlaeota bacterium]|nr:protein kinase [Candidatus Sumerlaeota bacterium]